MVIIDMIVSDSSSRLKLLQQWPELHPLRSQNQYPLWISTATNFKNQPLGLRSSK
jgi:hypothetical protein